VPPGRGYETRVEGYGSPQEKEGVKVTQHLLTSNHSQPFTSTAGGFKPKVPLKPSGPPMYPSRPSVQKTEGVEFEWAETSEEEEEPTELLKELSIQREREELEKQEQDLGYDFEKLLRRADELSRRHTSFLEKVRGSQVAKEREEILESMTKEGEITQLILANSDLIKQMDVQDSDMMSCTMREKLIRVIDFNRRLRRPVSLTVNETNITLAASTRLIEELFPTLSGKVNQDLLEEVRLRHGVLSEGLQQKLVKKEVARLFPRDHALRIMEWYGKLNLCMEEMFVIRRRQSAATWTLEALCSNYPGPKLFQTEWNQSMASEKTLKVEETAGQSITESNYRAKASRAGKGYRMAEGSGMHLMTESAGRGGYDFRIQGMEERVQQSPGMVQDTGKMKP
jgi:hypothetical protein